MARNNHTQRLARTEEAVTVLSCLIDDAYALLNPNRRRYEPLKRLSDSEVITLALLQQLRGVESERSFLRDVQRSFSHPFPGVVGLHPSSFHDQPFRKPLSERQCYRLAADHGAERHACRCRGLRGPT